MNNLFSKSNTCNNGTSFKAPCFAAADCANMLTADTVIGVLFAIVCVIVNPIIIVDSIIRVLSVIIKENRISKACYTV